MTTFALQTAVVLLLAFAAGCIMGCWLAGRIGTRAESAGRKRTPARQTAGTKTVESGPAKPRAAERDNLKLLSGVGPVIEKKLNARGVTRFEQIAMWKKADIDRFDAELSFRGRIEREKWVSQAKTLARGGKTEFSKRAAGKGRRKTSRP